MWKLGYGNKCLACPKLSSMQEGKSSIGNTYEKYLLYFMLVEDGHCYKSVLWMHFLVFPEKSLLVLVLDLHFMRSCFLMTKQQWISLYYNVVLKSQV